MIGQSRRLSSLILCGSLLLAACAGPAAEQSTTQPAAKAERAEQQTQPLAITPAQAYPLPTLGSARGYPAPATQSPSAPAAEPSTDIAVPVEPTMTPIATPAPLAVVQGEVVLRLSAGDGRDQVGIGRDVSGTNGPRAFRIGSDGTIRILDSVNKRVLFFGQNGKLLRTLKLDADPIDFIVDNQGEVFVYASDGGRNQVLHYDSRGKLIERLLVASGASVPADGIMLNSNQDVMLVQANQVLWVLRRSGIVVAPEIQPLTRQDGTVTPRSPVIFQTVTTAEGTSELRVIGLTAGAAGDAIGQVATVALNLPADARFFNIDRAMNLYFTNTPNVEWTNMWRVSPDGTIAGGARIAPGCQLSWRTFYIDQAGTAWTLCTSPDGATVTHYHLLDAQGQLLPAAEQEAADVAWRPGKRLDGA